MGVPDYDIMMSPKKVYSEIINFINICIEMKETEYSVRECYNNMIKKMNETCFWNLYCTSDKVCMHVYNRGSKKGQICGNKIFITTDNKMQTFLCSRHCRDYGPKSRLYTDEHERCNHIRNNNIRCKHKCEKNKKYCYIHKEQYIEELNKELAEKEIDENYKKVFIEKLKNRRIKHLKKISKKQKLLANLKKHKKKNNNRHIDNLELPEKMPYNVDNIPIDIG